MGSRRIYERNDEAYKWAPWHKMHLAPKGYLSFVIKDSLYRTPRYRTEYEWRPAEGFGVLSLFTVTDQLDRTESEVKSDIKGWIEEVWGYRKSLTVVDSQGCNGQCTVFTAFRLPEIPTREAMEKFYRLIKNLESSAYSPADAGTRASESVGGES